MSMSLFGSNGESDFIDWSSGPSYTEQWSPRPSHSHSSVSASSSAPEEELHTILTMDEALGWSSLGGSQPLVRDQDKNWAPVEPIQAQTRTTPTRLMSDASWDAVRQRRTEQGYSVSPSRAQAGSSSRPWRPWDDPPSSHNVPRTSGPSSFNTSNATPSLHIPSDHQVPSPHPPEPPTKSRIVELLNSMNQPVSALPSKGNGMEDAKQEEEDPTALSAFTCPICFCPPENATLTPCGHVMCGKCLFNAVKAARQRHAGLYGREGLAPDGTRNEAVCPVCRAPIVGWDGRGGGVIGLSMMVEEV